MSEDQIPLLRIRGWDELHENNRTREIARLAYVLVQNDLADDDYISLTDHPEGAAHLGGWMAIRMVASRVPRPYRGYLRRNDGRAHDARSLALATRLPIQLFEILIPRLLNIGLLEDATAKPRKSKSLPSHHGAAKPQEGAAKPQEGAAKPQEGAAPLRARALQNRTEFIIIIRKN
jgi:hypothetical protein